MTDTTELTIDQGKNEEEEKEKSPATLDYEAGQEHLANEEISQAANMFHNALIGFEQEENLHGVANASDKLGDICADRDDYDKAMEHYERAYKICSDDFDRFSLFAIEKKKAALFHKAGKHAESINAYLDVLDEYNSLQNPKGGVETLETIADIYITMGENKKAADAYRVAASIHKNYKHNIDASKLLHKADKIEAGIE